MCDANSALSCARDQLLPFARDHCFPRVREAVTAIWYLPTEVTDMKAELETIEGCIYDAERMAEAEEDNTPGGMKARVKHLRVSFDIEDVIDEYTICEGQQPLDPGCAAAVDLVKTMILRLQLAYKIQKIRSRIREMKDTSGGDGLHFQSSSEQGPSSSTRNPDATLDKFQKDYIYMDEADIVGFDAPSAKLVDWLVNGRAECTVILVVGMGGLGKSTLAKKVYDSKEVAGHFECRAWITVSQPYTVEGLLRDMLCKFYKQNGACPPESVFEMNKWSLIDEVRNQLRHKRYVVVFDDVWDELFWVDFQHAFIDDRIGSRIFITARKKNVVGSCTVEVHELRPLNLKKSLELFNKKAFLNLNEQCPGNLKNVSSKIVEKCEGLPLAIVAIGSHLSTQSRRALEWQKFSENLSSELSNNSRLTVIKKILGFSFHDLPYHLNRCLLYFGIYPENYEVKTVRLIQQWVAEGFVKDEGGKVEEVAEKHLTELIDRSLVQVSSLASDGKTRSCRVHYLIRQMILDKIQTLSFCHFANEIKDQSVRSGMVRRLKIASSFNNLMESVECSNIRSLHVFSNNELPDSFVTSIPSKYRLLKVLDFEDVPLYHYVPQNLGDLFHLRYLSFRNTKVRNLPGSIGMLRNLETLDIRQTMVREMPREINKLRKLIHLLAYDKSKGVGYGIQMHDGIGDIASLQTLREVEADHGGVDRIIELERLTQLRKLGLTNVKQGYTSALRSSINVMQLLEKLYIAATADEVIDLHFVVSLPRLWKLRLIGKLARFPNWVPELQNLVKLSLSHSMLTHDPLTSLKDLQNLLHLSILYRAYEGERLQFPDEGFQNLKQIELRHLYNLNSISIGGGALSSLEKFKLVNIPQLKEVPSSVHNLPKLQVFQITNMLDEFTQSIDRVRGQHHWIIEQVPLVRIYDPFWA